MQQLQLQNSQSCWALGDLFEAAGAVFVQDQRLRLKSLYVYHTQLRDDRIAGWQ